MRPTYHPVRRVGAGAVVVALVGTLALAGCSGSGNPLSALRGTSVDSAREAQLAGTKQAIPDESLVEPGYLTVGLSSASVGAPLLIKDSDGTLSGIDIDLASKIASDLGLKVRFVDVGGVESALGAKICDVVMDVTPERAGSATIVGTYYETSSAFFRKGEETVVTVGELSGKTVGIQAGSVSENALNATALDMKREPFANLNEAFDALEKGTVDFVLCDAYPGAYLGSAFSDISFAGALSNPVPVGIAAAAGNTAVADTVKSALATTLANGTYEIVRGQWLGGMPAVTADKLIAAVPPAPEPVAQHGTGENVNAGGLDGSTAGANAVFVPNQETAAE